MMAFECSVCWFAYREMSSKFGEEEAIAITSAALKNVCVTNGFLLDQAIELFGAVSVALPAAFEREAPRHTEVLLPWVQVTQYAGDAGFPMSPMVPLTFHMQFQTSAQTIIKMVRDALAIADLETQVEPARG